MLSELLLYLVFFPTALASTITTTVGRTTTSSVDCSTRYGRRMLGRNTATTTCTEIVIAKSVSTPVTTVTPTTQDKIVTVSRNQTTTGTLTGTTVTVSNVTTQTKTKTKTESGKPVTTTITRTANTTTGTETFFAPAPTGFIPIYESSGDTTYNGAPVNRKAVLGGLYENNAMLNLFSGKVSPWGKRSALDGPNRRRGMLDLHPESVMCVKNVTIRETQLLIEVRPRSTVTAATPIHTAHRTRNATVTATSTLPPNTATRNSNTTTTTTTTTTITDTVTSYTTTTPTSNTTTTSYLACATNNLLGPQINDAAHSYIYSLTATGEDAGIDTSFAEANNAYECCVACLKTDGCLFSGFVTTNQTKVCEIFTDAEEKTCDPRSNPAFFNKVDSSPYGAVLSNGPCGTITDGSKQPAS